MKFIKVFSVLAAISAVACFASCSGGGSETGEKPELNVLMSYTSDDVNNHVIAKLLEEKTGYKVNYETLPQDRPFDKLNLIMAGGEKYDVISMNKQKSVYANYAGNGALLDLSPLLEKYGQNILTKISSESMDRVKVDGVQYAIPNTSSAAVGSSIVIRTDWLEKLGLSMPQTVEDFTAVLKAFKEQDPGNNGDKNVPFVIASGNVIVPNLQGAFGIVNDWIEKDGSLAANVTLPEFKQYVTYMRSLYEDGLIDKEFAAMNAANAKEKFTSGQAGAMIVGYYDLKNISTALSKINPDAKFEYIPLLKGENGTCGIASNAGAVDKIIFIPKAAEHPEDAVKWMNAKLEDDLFREYTIGTEGVHFEIRDGAYYPILPIFYDERNAASTYLTGVDESVYPQYWQARIRKDEEIFEGWDYINNNEEYKANQKPAILDSAPYIKAYDDNVQTLTTMINDFIAETIAGNKDINSSVDDFIKSWRAEGGAEMETAVNEWYSSTK